MKLRAAAFTELSKRLDTIAALLHLELHLKSTEPNVNKLENPTCHIF